MNLHLKTLGIAALLTIPLTISPKAEAHHHTSPQCTIAHGAGYVIGDSIKGVDNFFTDLIGGIFLVGSEFNKGLQRGYNQPKIIYNTPQNQDCNRCHVPLQNYQPRQRSTNPQRNIQFQSTSRTTPDGIIIIPYENSNAPPEFIRQPNPQNNWRPSRR